MSKSVKIAISLPEEVLRAVEHERLACGQSRSEYIREALEEQLRRQRQRQDVERYVQSYREQPESDEEIATATQLAARAFAEDPWP